MLFERLFRQVYLPTLDVEVGQVPDHAATSHPQHLSSLLHPAMTRPFYILIIGQQLATQDDPRLLPEGERLLWHRYSARLSNQVLKGIGIDPQAGLLRQFEDLAVVALLEQFFAISRAQYFAQDFACRAQRFPRFLLVGLRPQDACQHALGRLPPRRTQQELEERPRRGATVPHRFPHTRRNLPCELKL